MTEKEYSNGLYSDGYTKNPSKENRYVVVDVSFCIKITRNGTLFYTKKGHSVIEESINCDKVEAYSFYQNYIRGNDISSVYGVIEQTCITRM